MKFTNLTWNNVTVEVQNPKNKDKMLRILDNVSGEAKAGRMHIIMGPSGSGKSTLINTLMGVVPKNFKSAGSILLDGETRKPGFKNLVAMCDQDDIFYEHYSAEQFLHFHAKGINRHLSYNERKSRIDFLLDRLRLTGRKDTLVSKLSGGEKKRLILISELMTDKKIIFLDEPTSGLDSHLALDLICFLKEITIQKNLIMFVTIHQPSPTIVRMFDDFTFIAWGRLLYHGEFSKCEDYFKENGFVKPENITFTEYLFELTTEKSCFNEIVPNLEKVQKLLPPQAEPPTNSTKSFYIFDTRLSFGVILSLFSRNLYRYLINLLSVGFFVFLIFAILFSYYLKRFISFCMEKELDSTYLSYSVLGALVDCLVLSIFFMIGSIFFSTCITQRSFSFCFTNTTLIRIELRNGSYTHSELLLSTWIFCFFTLMIASIILFFPLLFISFSVFLKSFLILIPCILLLLVIFTLIYFNFNFMSGIFVLFMSFFNFIMNIKLAFQKNSSPDDLFYIDFEKHEKLFDFFSFFFNLMPYNIAFLFLAYKLFRWLLLASLGNSSVVTTLGMLYNFKTFFVSIQARVNDRYKIYGINVDDFYGKITYPTIAIICFILLIGFFAFKNFRSKYSQNYRYKLSN